MTDTTFEKTQTARAKLVTLLEEMFQLDQPDLDFGFYRIMHAKADQVRDFLNKDLLDTIRDAFGAADAEKVAAAEQAVVDARAQARSFGAEDPDATGPVQAALRHLAQARGEESREGEVYDHLTRFFERYYDRGDFMSRRFYGRESASKAAPYAVPYDGREVYLHWANRDQYYVKSAEYLSNFSFDLTKAKELPNLPHTQQLRVHCRLVDGNEGEHGNVKASDATERFFLIHEGEPVKVEQGTDGHPELVLQFEYRTDPQKTGQSAKHQAARLAEAKGWIRDTLAAMPHVDAFTQALAHPIPTEKDKDRTLLDRYVAQYTARNTMDYFIHKDLSGFLRRELDFYIKNEIMNLDDLGHDAGEDNLSQVTDYLKLIKVLRKIAHTLIDLLASLEEFQKKLWLKKKFVTETEYCITLDRIPEEFYPEIAANDAQRAEWVSLFAIDELDGYSEPLTVDFLKANPFLVIDTAFFASSFKDSLMASIQDFDGAVSGQLICTENSQALNLLKRKYSKSIDTVITDPPYNTGDDGFYYKDNYSHSTWISMMDERVLSAKDLLKDISWLSFNINDIEFKNLVSVLEKNSLAPISVIAAKMSHMSGMKMTHADRKPPKIKEYITLSNTSEKARINPIYEQCSWWEAFDRYDSYVYKNKINDPSTWSRVSLKKAAIEARIDVENKAAYEDFCIENADCIYQRAKNDSLNDLPKDGVFKEVTTATGLKKIALDAKEVLFASNYFKEINGKKVPAKVKGDIWDDIGINNSHNEGGVSFDNGKKPVKLFERLVEMLSQENSIILDYLQDRVPLDMQY